MMSKKCDFYSVRSQGFSLGTLGKLDRSGPFTNSSEIYKTNLFTKLHDDWANYVTSRVHVIQLTGTIFELNSRIKETNVLTKCHENWAKNVTYRVITIFNLVRDINKTNVLTNFHDDWAKMVSLMPNKKTAPPTCGHVFKQTRTTFKLIQHIIKTNILTKSHEDWA
ncbi:hypothetical protein DPMN_051485 [Dreissena polymorpha]|uniref:Uncharacterized protein n=1 Tax=Dreissena polymorpha TaxID=45954 RepID=A0A9D4HM64_DREPO|nr:hypothetical protein DPMN_051485 [Dreissena polymorpha]